MTRRHGPEAQQEHQPESDQPHVKAGYGQHVYQAGGGKAIAENPNVPTAAAIANAIADACGVRLFDLPLSAEKVYWAMQKRN